MKKSVSQLLKLFIITVFLKKKVLVLHLNCVQCLMYLLCGNISPKVERQRYFFPLSEERSLTF